VKSAGSQPVGKNPAGKPARFDYGAPRSAHPARELSLLRTKPLFGLVAIAALALLLAGCGRRGPLEPPPYTAQGQALAKQRASQNAKRGLVTSEAQPTTPAEQAEADNVKRIEEQSQDAQDDSAPERLRHDPLTAYGETQMPFATSTNLVRPPKGPINDKAGMAGSDPLRGGNRKMPIPRPNKSFVLDPLLE
jgi:predicted small lipoprotein YifL